MVPITAFMRNMARTFAEEYKLQITQSLYHYPKTIPRNIPLLLYFNSCIPRIYTRVHFILLTGVFLSFSPVISSLFLYENLMLKTRNRDEIYKCTDLLGAKKKKKGRFRGLPLH